MFPAVSEFEAFGNPAMTDIEYRFKVMDSLPGLAQVLTPASPL